MAFGETQFTSFLNERPQENQYLQGNPATNPNAQTDWMNPENTSSNTGFSGFGGSSFTPPAPISSQQDGTALGAISAGGSFGAPQQQQAGQIGSYMPGGYDQNKWANPEHTTPKYIIGRILSKYPPTPEGYAAAQNELMQTGLISGFGKDSLMLNDKSGYGGHNIDVGRAFSDPNGQRQWQWLDQFQDGTAGNSQQPMSFMNNGSQGQGINWQSFMNNMMNQQFQAQQGQRFNNAGQPNPTGGFIPPTGGISGWGSGIPNSDQRGLPGEMVTSLNPGTPFNINNGLYQPGDGSNSVPERFNKFPGQNPFAPNPDANGYYGGWQDEHGLRHPGNQPGMSYML